MGATLTVMYVQDDQGLSRRRHCHPALLVTVSGGGPGIGPLMCAVPLLPLPPRGRRGEDDLPLQPATAGTQCT